MTIAALQQFNIDKDLTRSPAPTDALPIDDALPGLAAALAAGPFAVLVAPPVEVRGTKIGEPVAPAAPTNATSTSAASGAA